MVVIGSIGIIENKMESTLLGEFPKFATRGWAKRCLSSCPFDQDLPSKVYAF